MNEPRKKVLLVRDDLSECRHIVELIDEPGPAHEHENESSEDEGEDLCVGQ